jgi:hypothetical protein
MNLKKYFILNKNTERKRWEFTPNEKIYSTSYTISFYEVNKESDAWEVLLLAIERDSLFRIIVNV